MVRALEIRCWSQLAIAALVLLPALAFGQSLQFTKTVGTTANAMEGCWPDGTGNSSDSGAGQYIWTLTLTNNNVIAQLLAQAAAGNPATVVFSDSGNVATLGSAGATEGLTASPTFLMNTVSIGAGSPSGRTFTVNLTTANLSAAGVNACTDDLAVSITLNGDAGAWCAQFSNSHADAVWRGQGVYPNIKPVLNFDNTLPGCP